MWWVRAILVYIYISVYVTTQVIHLWNVSHWWHSLLKFLSQGILDTLISSFWEIAFCSSALTYDCDFDGSAAAFFLRPTSAFPRVHAVSWFSLTFAKCNLVLVLNFMPFRMTVDIWYLQYICFVKLKAYTLTHAHSNTQAHMFACAHTHTHLSFICYIWTSFVFLTHYD